jgi:hypothetical protein
LIKYSFKLKCAKSKSIITLLFLHNSNNSSKVNIFSPLYFLLKILPKSNSFNSSKVLEFICPLPLLFASKLVPWQITGTLSFEKTISASTIWNPLLIASLKAIKVLCGRYPYNPACDIKLFNSIYLLKPSFGLCKIFFDFLTIYKYPPPIISWSILTNNFLLSLYNFWLSIISGLNTNEILLSSSNVSL